MQQSVAHNKIDILVSHLKLRSSVYINEMPKETSTLQINPQNMIVHHDANTPPTSRVGNHAQTQLC